MSDEDDEKTLYTSEGEPIKWLNQDYRNHLDRSTLIFGASGSGKTTLIEEILYLCKDYIPNYIVIAPETSRDIYASKLPKACIKDNLSKEKLDAIWKRQVDLTRVVKIANSTENLERLFNRANDTKAKADVAAIVNTAKMYISMIEKKKEYSFSEKRTTIANIKERCDENIKKIYKATITKNLQHLQRLHENNSLNETEIITLHYYNVNPRLCIIIDDKTEYFEKWMKYYKKEKEDANVFQSMFYTGRHNYITLIITAHDDKAIAPDLRKNARVIYYTTSQALVVSMERTANGFTKDQKKFGQRAASVVFGQEDMKTTNYKKLCYLRNDPYPFRYIIANIYGPFTLENDALRELSKKIPTQESSIEENPFVAGLISTTKKKKKRPVIQSTIVSRNRKY
jgi:molybdopterin-guanine dinucleotide biosynthesis protein